LRDGGEKRKIEPMVVPISRRLHPTMLSGEIVDERYSLQDFQFPIVFVWNAGRVKRAGIPRFRSMDSPEPTTRKLPIAVHKLRVSASSCVAGHCAIQTKKLPSSQLVTIRQSSPAPMYTLIGSANLSGLDPELYLRTVLAQIADHSISQIQDLLHWTLAPSLQTHSSQAA
jgi:hypothetical protein